VSTQICETYCTSTIPYRKITIELTSVKYSSEGLSKYFPKNILKVNACELANGQS